MPSNPVRTQASAPNTFGSANTDSAANSNEPGAYKMAGGPRNQRFFVTIPRGVRPGQHFAVLVNGTQMMVRCPEGQQAGDRLIVTPPRQENSQQFIVTVPDNVRPGQQFRVMIQDQEVLVTCPPGVSPQQRVTFQMPQQKPTPTTSPNHQMFEVTVPQGVKGGQPFALIANGKRVMVTCPPNVRPGQKIRFQLPVQLGSSELSALKIGYDKDGFMRVLGTDLKFAWVYNKTDDSKPGSDQTASRASKYNIQEHAYVRLLKSSDEAITCIPPEDYRVETVVTGLREVNYNKLTDVAGGSFQSKCDWLKKQFNDMRLPWEEGHIKIKVRRSHLLQDALDALATIEVPDYKRIFKFEFLGEPGLDAGGVAREFYQIVSEMLFNPDCGLFLSSSINQMCMKINPASDIANEQHLRYFKMTGRLLGKALMDGQLVPVHLVRPLYKHIMGWPICFDDLEHLEDDVHRNLLQLLDFEDPTMVEHMCLSFDLDEDKLGIKENIELIPGGSNIDVTDKNLAEYLDAQLQYRTVHRIEKQLREFLKGFYEIVPEPLLTVLDFQELELMMHGLPEIEMSDWKRHTLYTGDFSSQKVNHRVVQWFWDIVGNFPQDLKARLLQFVTGTSGVPPKGFAGLQGNDGNVRLFTMHGDKNVKVFPRAHTCFNRIDMPIYKSKADMQKYLTLAVNMEASGFGIE
jgi:E3 ubiquitin-protein ligase NEDD4